MATQSFSKQSCQIKMVCQKLEQSDWSYTPVRNIVWPITGRIRKFSLVENLYRFPAFWCAATCQSEWKWTFAWLEGLQTLVQSMNLLSVKKTKRTKKKTRQNVTILKQMLRSRKVQDFTRRNSPERDERMYQRIYYYGSKEGRDRNI